MVYSGLEIYAPKDVGFILDPNLVKVFAFLHRSFSGSLNICVVLISVLTLTLGPTSMFPS